jgi:peptide/nickel transport system permease protein
MSIPDPVSKEPGITPEKRKPPSTGLRVARYISIKFITLFLMVVIAIYLSIILVNYGGGIDDIFRDQITMTISGENLNRLALHQAAMTSEEAEQFKWQMEESFDLHRPFLVRSAFYLYDALKFDWGSKSYFHTSYGRHYGSVVEIILERLPFTLVLSGTANLFLFLISISIALYIARRGKERLGRTFGFLSPLSSIPNWMYGLVLILIFAATLNILPYGGIFDGHPSANPVDYVLDFGRHMILPFAAIFLGMFFHSVHSWRTFFQMNSDEDFVDLARAKGVPVRELDRQYIIRPALPFVLTSFVLMLVTFWQGVAVLEMLFHWPGIGELFVLSLQANDRQISTGLLVLFAYILAITIFLMDFIIVLIDPRIRAENREPIRTPAAFFSKENRPWKSWSIRKSRRGKASLKFPTQEFENTNPRVKDPNPFRDWWNYSRLALKRFLRSPLGVVGLAIISILVVVSISTVILIPPDEAAIEWRAESSTAISRPKSAKPAWTNFFRKDDLPVTLVMGSVTDPASKTVTEDINGVGETTIEFTFNYPYKAFPQDMAVMFEAQTIKKNPFVTLTWITPDLRETELMRSRVNSGQSFIISRDFSGREGDTSATQFTPSLSGTGGQAPAIESLFISPAENGSEAQRGKYTLRIKAFTFEPGSNLDTKMILYGKVFGLAGTDNQRRDLKVGLLWGLPIALLIGIIGALATTLLSLTIAAVAAWFGGWVDGLIQRISEISMIIPAFALALTIFYMVSNSIWLAFSAIILLMVFGNAVKTYRAAFVQVLQSGYIEAARSYGASDWRIIWHYMVPVIIPLLIPQITIMVPFFVFYETSLAFVGVMDPVLPTWGKMVYDALDAGAYSGYNYWVIQPIALMLITGIAFAMLGTALNSALNPKADIE